MNFINQNNSTRFRFTPLEERIVLDASLVADIAAGATDSTPTEMTDVDGTLFFVADDGTSGAELWKSDGTEAGTVLVKDIRARSTGSNPAYLTNVNG
ncbi:MAG: ELWxxDGT repeat protein, partial [Waddliaceae bacterium]